MVGSFCPPGLWATALTGAFNRYMVMNALHLAKHRELSGVSLSFDDARVSRFRCGCKKMYFCILPIRTAPRYAGHVAEPTQFVSLLRRLLPFFTVVLLAAIAYDGWVFYSRWSSTRQAELAQREKDAAGAQKTLDLLGGGGLKILSFYATPGAIHPGEHASLCYGVTGAQSVRLEPAIEELHPALSYCMQVSPAKDTEYKLFAQDAAGHSVTSGVTIRVMH